MRSIPYLECATFICLGLATVCLIRPVPLSEQIHGNEKLAIQFLKEISKAEQAFYDRTNGTSYALLDELMGASSARPIPTTPALLQPSRFDLVLARDGYVFAVYLPSKDLRGTLRSSSIDPANVGAGWVAFAWPLNYAQSGRRLFGVGPDGVIWSLENSLDSFEGMLDLPPPVLFARHLTGTPFGRPPAWVASLRWTIES
jgi:hypothetical protein